MRSQRNLVLSKKGGARVGAGRPVEGTRSLWGRALEAEAKQARDLPCTSLIILAYLLSSRGSSADPTEQEQLKQQTETLV